MYKGINLCTGIMSAGALYPLQSPSLSPVSYLIPQLGCVDGGIKINVIVSFYQSLRSLGCILRMLGNFKNPEGDLRTVETHKHDLPPSFSVQVRPSTETGLGTQSDSMLAIAAFHWGRNQVLGDRVGGWCCPQTAHGQ